MSELTELMKSIDENNKILKAILSKTSLINNQLYTDGYSGKFINWLKLHQLSYSDTMDEIIYNHKSMARFGDGEMTLMLREPEKFAFQKFDKILAKKLYETLVVPKEDLLITFPYHGMEDDFFKNLYNKFGYELLNILPENIILGNTHITRPAFFQAQKDIAIKKWRQVWENKDITIVTGEGSRFELIPELFDNIKSSKFIYFKPTDAFDDYDKIVEEVQKDTNELILFSLGMTATVLVHDLADKTNKQLLDIGHITSSYNTVFKNAGMPEATKMIRS